MRACPVCCSEARELLYEYHLTSGPLQQIYSCLPCGMVYASVPEHVDYEHSIYEVAGAIGSGASEHDRKRLAGVAETVERSSYGGKSIRILDVGCGQGGLLDALRDRGFTGLTGLDPSSVCATETTRRGHRAHCGFLSSLSGKFDFITLSHVLEHVEDAHGFLGEVLARLCSYGRIYVEVPNASRFVDYSGTLPLLDFNSEHINHFDADSLNSLLDRCGLGFVDGGEKQITLTSGALYPAIWTVAGRKSHALQVRRYIHTSALHLARANSHLEHSLSATSDVAIWGAGEYLAHVLRLPAIASRRVVQVADRNPALHGRIVAGCPVVAPSSLSAHVPIVIAAVVAGPAIKREADAMGLNAIPLEF